MRRLGQEREGARARQKIRRNLEAKGAEGDVVAAQVQVKVEAKVEEVEVAVVLGQLLRSRCEVQVISLCDSHNEGLLLWLFLNFRTRLLFLQVHGMTRDSESSH